MRMKESGRHETSRRYRFGGFTLSPSRRLLLREGREVPLIPRYFDLLLLLVERRHEAVRRRDILDSVWSDVVVTDGALSQAVRTLRRALGDGRAEPRFIRTVSRHGYRFVFDPVEEESDEGADVSVPAERPGRAGGEDPFEAHLRVLLDPSGRGGGELDEPGREGSALTAEERRRDAAEALHALGTAEALRRLGRRPGQAVARALLRDARWDLPSAGPVPILGRPQALACALALVGLRLRRVVRVAGRRWTTAVAGGALAGGVAGGLGGALLRFGPGSSATGTVLVALPLVGAVIGATGAAGVGAGLAAAEALFRSARSVALVILGALGGGAIGMIAHLAASTVLEGVFGSGASPMAGGFEGLVIGGAAGAGYALATPRAEGGMASPRGRARVAAALVAGAACALATAVLGWSGSHLGAMSLDVLSRAFPGSQASLDPLARLLGEPGPGAVTRTAISAFEGLMFGAGLVAGITTRPRRPR